MRVVDYYGLWADDWAQARVQSWRMVYAMLPDGYLGDDQILTLCGVPPRADMEQPVFLQPPPTSLEGWAARSLRVLATQFPALRAAAGVDGSGAFAGRRADGCPRSGVQQAGGRVRRCTTEAHSDVAHSGHSALKIRPHSSSTSCEVADAIAAAFTALQTWRAPTATAEK